MLVVFGRQPVSTRRTFATPKELLKMTMSPDVAADPQISAPTGVTPSPNTSIEDQTLLLLARLMEGGQEDEDTCKGLSRLTKMLDDDSSQATRSSEPHKPIIELLDTDCVETILSYLDMRQAPSVRGYATLTASAFLKAAGDQGVKEISSFFHLTVGKGTYDDFILAFSVAASLFPIVPDLIAELFLKEGFVVSLGPLMKRKWKSKKVEQAALEMLNAASMHPACRESIKKDCTEWLDEIVNDIPPTDLDVSSPERHRVAEAGAIQQRIHSPEVRNLAAVVLAKLQVGSLRICTLNNPTITNTHRLF
jgi:hypothetical protein